MEIWHFDHPDDTFVGCGNRSLLDAPLTAFFASRQCPGTAIRAAMDWALEQARRRQPVVGGFHAPLEQSVLKVLLQARCPAVVVLARPVAGARLPPEWAAPLAEGRMAVLSAATHASRLTEGLAAHRNACVAQLASQIVVGHASAGGQLAALCDSWSAAGRSVRRLTEAAG